MFDFMPTLNSISARSLKMLNKAATNLKKGLASAPIDKVCTGRDLAGALAETSLSAEEAAARHRDLRAGRQRSKD